MSLDRAAIEAVFGPRPFPHALFYARPGGLRFELSEGPGAIRQFLSAMRKSLEICEAIFDGPESVGICLSKSLSGSPFCQREVLRDLRELDIRIPRGRSFWVEAREPDEDSDGDDPVFCFFVAFEVPRRLLQNVLWCAIAGDFGTIAPNPGCRLYMFDLSRRVLVHPYDDRGMDVVGDDRPLLAAIYKKYGHWLLNHDRGVMDATFGG